VPTGGNLKIIQVGSHEDDAGGRRRRQDPDLDWDAVVKADSRGLDGPLYGSFKTQRRTPDASSILI
jgi:hypothetical protein